MKYAPIIIFCYNRLDSLKLLINSLLKNKEFLETELIIYSDAAKTSHDLKNVELVRAYVDSMDIINRKTIIKREVNFGLAKNIINGVTEVINNFGKVIVLEDDLIVSENFLCYMNSALNFYKNREYIFSISGYTAQLKSLKNYEKDTYLSYRPSSWGWATWKNKWDGIDWKIEHFNEFSKDRVEVNRFNRGGIDMYRMLKHYMIGKNNSWAIRWAYAMYKKDKYAIYPKISKIQNIGFGEDATHCKGENIYKTSLDNTSRCSFIFNDEKIINNKIASEFRYQYSYYNKLSKKLSIWLKGLKG